MAFEFPITVTARGGQLGEQVLSQLFDSHAAALKWIGNTKRLGATHFEALDANGRGLSHAELSALGA